MDLVPGAGHGGPGVEAGTGRVEDLGRGVVAAVGPVGAADHENPTVRKTNRVVFVAGGRQLAGGLPPPGSGVVQLGARIHLHRLPAPLMPADHQHAPVGQRGGGVTLPRDAERADGLRAAGTWIEHLGTGQERPSASHPTDDQDPTAGKERGGVATPALEQLSEDREPAARRIEDFHRLEIGAIVPPREYHPAIGKGSRRVAGPGIRHRPDRLDAGG